jgi:hypothetical protein
MTCVSPTRSVIDTGAARARTPVQTARDEVPLLAERGAEARDSDAREVLGSRNGVQSRAFPRPISIVAMSTETSMPAAVAPRTDLRQLDLRDDVQPQNGE